MIFPYVRYKVESTVTIPSGVIHRPEIRIRLIGRKGSIQISGLLDTGADNVFVSGPVADVLGADEDSILKKAVSAGGGELDVWSDSVQIELSHDGELLRWPAKIGFLVGDDEPPIAYLGHAGFLERFNATFDTENWQIELIPH